MSRAPVTRRSTWTPKCQQPGFQLLKRNKLVRIFASAFRKNHKRRAATATGVYVPTCARACVCACVRPYRMALSCVCALRGHGFRSRRARRDFDTAASPGALNKETRMKTCQRPHLPPTLYPLFYTRLYRSSRSFISSQRLPFHLATSPWICVHVMTFMKKYFMPKTLNNLLLHTRTIIMGVSVQTKILLFLCCFTTVMLQK